MASVWGKGDILITLLSPKDSLLTLGGDNADPRVRTWELAMAKLRNLTNLYQAFQIYKIPCQN